MARQEKVLMETMGDLTPNTAALPFRVKTSDVESWIQSIFDNITDEINKTRDADKKVPRVTISLITLKASGKYAPFVLAMSKNVLKNQGKKKSNSGKNDFVHFDVKESDSAVVLWPQYYSMVGSWMYNKDDMKGLTSSDARRRLDITRSVGATLQQIRTPKLMPFSGTDMVTVLLDPLRVFWMMLRDVNNKDDKNFLVDVVSFKMISKTSAEFDLIRRVKKSKNKENLAETMAAAFGRKLRS